MSSLNQVNLIGRLGQDPEYRMLQNGGVANLSLATSEKWRDKATGEQKEATEWHRVVVYGKLAEICSQYLAKGSLVYIEGSLKTRKWQDNAGIDRYTTEIQARNMRILSGNNNGQPQNNAGQQQRQQSQQQRSQQQNTQQQNFDEDIPF